MWRADIPARGRGARGFSLVELVVVIAIVGVLATLAYPSFRAQWLKARRGDARAALLQLQQQQERWRADHRTYAGGAELGAATVSPQGHYRLSVLAPSGTGYELRAEALGAQRHDTLCQVLRVHRADGRTQLLSDAAPGDAAHARCWAP